MITLENIGFEFGGRWLFRDTTLQIKPGDRIGLVGRNGTGKTTLLKLLNGHMTPVEGKVSMARGLKIGYLEQEMLSTHTGKSVFEVAMQAFGEQMQLRDEIDAILNNPALNHDEALVHQLADKQHALEAMDGYNIDAKIASVLAGLGFDEAAQARNFDTFSGGWRMRVMLAQLLLMEPDLLMLDEPTNHLDLPAIQWLEDYLKDFKGAFVIVSHDREFLDRLITSVVEISQGRFNRYKGNYSFYLKEKVVVAEQHQREYENQQKAIKDTERFIERFRAKATKAKQVQSKVKLLDKVDRIEAPEGEGGPVNFKFKAETTPGRNILDLKVKTKAFGDRVILHDSELHIYRGDKIALIGANGIGKSTILRIIANVEPFDGELTLGHNVKESFFAQHQLEALTPENEILQEMSKFVFQKGEAYVRGILGGFLFTGDDVFKKIKVLSGGEKSRVALAKTLLSEANFLMLDEPTNHLDIQSIQILSGALKQYEGTYIVVSHDRFFLREVANKIWYIEDGLVREFPGTYEEFNYHLALQKEKLKNEKKAQTDAATKQAKVVAAVAAPVVKRDYQQEKERKKRENKVKGDLERIEARIMELEEKKTELLNKMADPTMATKFDQLVTLQKESDAIDKELGPAQVTWEKLIEEMEQLQLEN
ncbi:MAG: ABC-F family ATP-binding cassette domain-containing protein [Bacteroidetes bacterium]|nr:ABC-F family ATP-binding cassette domain-containing protein [Bacteroidota bacterium]